MKFILLALLFLQGSAAKAPMLDADDQVSISVLSTLNNVANASCAQLDTTKAFIAQKDKVQKRLEDKYPGFTIDWNNLIMVKK